MSGTEEELEALREENTELKRQVQRVSEEMDKIQHRRHAKNKGPKEADSKLALVPAEVRIAIKQNEDLRKERLKLSAELQHSDTGRRIAEMKNALKVIEGKIAAAREELKALENQKRARKSIVEMAHHTEEELKLFRDQHREELNGFKQEAHELSEEQKHLDKQMIAMQVHIHRINEKIKLGVNGGTFSELKQKVQSQEREIGDLKEQLSKISSNLDHDAKRENRELKDLRNERARLQKRVEDLKQVQVEREKELKLSYNLTKPPGGVSPRARNVSA